MPNSADIRGQFDETGRVWIRQAMPDTTLEALREHCAIGNRPGARLSADGALADTISNAAFTQRIHEIWPDMRPVRIVSFDKNPDANWGVPWHQDRVIAVREKADVAGFSNWSRKHGGWHCEPPSALLRQMLFVRIHLDDNAAENGAMEIALGSHNAGTVPAAAAEPMAAQYQCEVTTARAGDVLIMSMLMLHRSRPAKKAVSRRVLRVDYAGFALPEPLAWAA